MPLAPGDVLLSLPDFEEEWVSPHSRLGGVKCVKRKYLFLRRCAPYRIGGKKHHHHTTDARYGYFSVWETKRGDVLGDDATLGPKPFPKQQSEQKGKGERQESLYISVCVGGRSEQVNWARLLAFGYKNPPAHLTRRLTWRDLKRLGADGQTVYVTDHLDRHHERSVIDNLAVILRSTDVRNSRRR